MQEGDIVCDFFQIIGDMGREEDAVLLVLNEFEQEVEDIIGLPAMDAPEISAKMGINIEAVLKLSLIHI